jgi:hypothetical protein
MIGKTFTFTFLLLINHWHVVPPYTPVNIFYKNHGPKEIKKFNQDAS